MKKLLIIAPHLSTGGMPQYLVKQIEEFIKDYEVYCIEWDNITGGVLVVQRNRIFNMLGDKLITLGDDKSSVVNIINNINPDIIHFQETPETFIDDSLLKIIYREQRDYFILVTTHSSYTDPKSIRFTADKFILVSNWSKNKFVEYFGENLCDIWEYPIDKNSYKNIFKNELGFDLGKVHILHVGLFTPGKNQKEIIELARVCKDDNFIFHFVGNQAENFRDYWEPLMIDLPDNCIWHGERDDVDKFYMASDLFYFPSLFELNPISIKEAIGYNLPIMLRNLPTYNGEYDNLNNIGINQYDNRDKIIDIFKVDNFVSIYDNLEKNNNIIQNIDPRFVINFINGPYLEVSNSIGQNFDVSFVDKKTGIIHYATNINNNSWTRSNISYFVDWKIIAKRNDGEVFEFDFDPTDQRVFIALESKSLGDTMAWFPYVDEFRKKWNCSVICSTFHNNLFVDQYPELEFVSPGSAVNGIYAMYKIGLFFEGDDINYKIHKKDPKKISLLEIATDILGLEYSEIRPRLKKSDIEKKKRVGIGFHSTAQTKYWNNPTGWQEVTDFLISKGYEVVIASIEEDGYMGNFYPKGATRIAQGNIDSLIDELNSCEFFIGISSGLSWLAWAINIPVVIISGFTDENLEPSDNVVRIIEKSVCNGCWSRHKFDPGDWNWCPDNKGTERQFECTKKITGKMVIDKIVENKLIMDDFKFDNRIKLGEFLNKTGLVNKGVEVGTFKGHFSKSILENWNGKLYMVDVWRPLSIEEYDDMSNHENHQDAYAESMNNIKGFEDRAFMLRMKGIYAAELFEDESLDFVYIDANHTYEGVKEDINIWYPKVKKGGLLLGHDYLPNDFYNNGQKDIPLYLFNPGQEDESTYAGMFGVNPAVDEFVSANNYDLYKTDEFLASWYFYKK